MATVIKNIPRYKDPQIVTEAQRIFRVIRIGTRFAAILIIIVTVISYFSI